MIAIKSKRWNRFSRRIQGRTKKYRATKKFVKKFRDGLHILHDVNRYYCIQLKSYI